MDTTEHFVRPRRKLNQAILLIDEHFAAKVDKLCTNHFQYIGSYDPQAKSLLLTRDEVIWLLEKRSLALYPDSSTLASRFDFKGEKSDSDHQEPLSVQCTLELLIDNSTKLNEYLVYVKLRSNGYIVWRPTYHRLSLHPSSTYNCTFVLFNPNSKFSKRNIDSYSFSVCYVLQEDSFCETVYEIAKNETLNNAVEILFAIVICGNVSFLKMNKPILPTQLPILNSK